MIVHLPLNPGQEVRIKAGESRKSFNGTVLSLVVGLKSNFAVIIDDAGHTHHCAFDEVEAAS